RRYVVSRTALWRTNGSSNFSREVIVDGSFGSQTLELDADPHSLPIHQRASKVVADTQYDGAGRGQKHRGERRLRSVEVEAANEQAEREETQAADLGDQMPRADDFLARAADHRQVVHQAGYGRKYGDTQAERDIVERGPRKG